MVVTLLVRHLPDGLPPHTLTRLFTHYGASETRPCAGGRLKNCAFVDFNNDGLAARAQSQLHRLRFLGKTLTVERANPVTEKQDLPSDGIKKEKEEGLAPPLPPYPPLPQAPPLPSVDSGAPTPTVVSASGGESIAPTLGVDYPFPPHLEYAYPPPDGDILTNIVNCLIAVPRFYTQVLHLMNKMNIPAPFRPALPTPPLPPPAPLPAPPKRQEGDLSSGESELESSNEEDDDMEAMNEETKNSEEAEPQLKRAKKRAKREAIVGPAVDKTTSHEAAGVKPIHITPKANLIRKNKPVLQIKITPKGSASGGGSEKHSQDVETVVDASIEEVDITNRAATLAELEAGKVAPTDILSLPMFKNYTPGNATQVLYIKNLAKEVTLEDLHFVYGAFFESLEDAKATLSIKLMQEGRMRDQAFVTFPSTQLAELALGMTHGYMLKGKPMIVQFGRNPFAAKNPPAT